MSTNRTISDIEDRFENKLSVQCNGTIDRVVVTPLGTIQVDVFDANMHDLDVIDELFGVESVEKRGGCLQITGAEQVAPCTGIL